jgi:hypothetical protein
MAVTWRHSTQPSLVRQMSAGAAACPRCPGGQQRTHDSLPTPAFSALDQDGGNLPNWLVDANNPLK